jgi:hypothetical protein
MFEVVVESWMLPVGSGSTRTALHDPEGGSRRRRLEHARDLSCVVVQLSLGLQGQSESVNPSLIQIRPFLIANAVLH